MYCFLGWSLCFKRRWERIFRKEQNKATIRNGEKLRKFFKKELRNCIEEKEILFREGRGKRMT